VDGSDDCRLLAVLREFDPRSPEDSSLTSLAVDPERQPFKVLYFDAPGDSEESWKRAYWPRGREKRRRELEGTERVFTHPMIAEVLGQEGALVGYELALQYWLYTRSTTVATTTRATGST
jgi:hypothetical protein